MLKIFLCKYTHASNLATSHHFQGYSPGLNPHYVLPPLMFCRSCCGHLLSCQPTFCLPYITQSTLLTPSKSDSATLLLKTLQWLPMEVKIPSLHCGLQRVCSLSVLTPPAHKAAATLVFLLFHARHAVSYLPICTHCTLLLKALPSFCVARSSTSFRSLLK